MAPHQLFSGYLEPPSKTASSPTTYALPVDVTGDLLENDQRKGKPVQGEHIHHTPRQPLVLMWTFWEVYYFSAQSYPKPFLNPDLMERRVQEAQGTR